MKKNEILGLVLITMAFILTILFCLVPTAWDNLGEGWGIGLWCLIVSFLGTGLGAYFNGFKE
jgi:hypothetical protein